MDSIKYLVKIRQGNVMESLLKVEGLSAKAEDKELLHQVSLEIHEGETHVLLGPNGAGKSTLGYAIMGSSEYEVTEGNIFFQGENVTEETSDKRARKGIFLSFQNPIEIPGISMANFLRTALEQLTGEKIKLFDFKKRLKSVMDTLQMDPSYADRDLNVGFSGGEKKKAEILQLLMLRPKLAILDETDSGLDVDAVKTVSKGIEEYHKSQNGALLIITHNAKILESLKVDKTHVLVDGRIVAEGGPEIIDEVGRNGFEKYQPKEA